MTRWLDSLMSMHSELESPKSFWYWSGLCAISAVVKDQVWLDKQIYKLYPNIYVMLHAKSGLKKGPPVNLAKGLVSIVNNTNIISGRSSIQGILKDMGTSESVPGGKIKSKSTVFICSSELSSSIVEDKVAMTILTDLYDRQYNEDEWRSLLKMESFTLKNPTVTMLTATNEAHSDDFFMKKDIEGGYFARTFIIHEAFRNKPNSLMWPLKNKPNKASLADYLKELGKLKGEFQPFASEEKSEIFTELRMRENREIYFSKAGALYEDWYLDFLKTVDEQDVADETGTLNRFGDSVLKVAMLLSLSESCDLIIKEDHVTEAIQVCEKLVGNIRKTTHGKKGMSTNAALKALVINEFLTRPNHEVTRTVLMKRVWMHYRDSKEFDDLMVTLSDMGTIEIGSQGNQVLYKMPKQTADELIRFLEGKNK